MPSISVCMIVKNEAKLLPRALGNLHDFWDELIVVDTGSTDDTVSIAKQHGATVLHYDWKPPGHKGEARNVGIDAARGEWIVVLDADEVIREPAQLRQEIMNCDSSAISPIFHNVNGNGPPSLVWVQPRCFRRGAYRYLHREHEVPVSTEPQPPPMISDVVFLHDPPADRQTPKIGPMLDRLALDVKEHSDDSHSRYFYARQLLAADKFEESIEQHLIYLDMADSEYHDKCEAYGNLSSCYHALGDHQSAIEWLYRAIAQQPERRTWWVRVAEIYLHINEVNLAQRVLELANGLWPVPELNHEPKYFNGYISQLLVQCQMRMLASWQQYGQEQYKHEH